MAETKTLADNLKENDTKEANDSVQRLAQKINIIKDDHTESNYEDDIAGLDEISPYERKIVPNTSSKILSQFEEHNANQDRFLTEHKSIDPHTKRYEYLNDKTIFNSTGSNKGTKEDPEALQYDPKYSHIHFARNSLAKLRDQYQRSTDYKTSYSQSSNFKKSNLEDEKSRNYDFKEAFTAAKPHLDKINEIEPSNGFHDNVFYTVQTPQ